MSLRELAVILRCHIMLIGMAACLVFGWLLTDHYPFEIAGLVALDWLLINLLNKISDVREDLANDIEGAQTLARKQRAFMIGWVATQAGSLGLGALLYPALTPWRLMVQVIGVGYSYRIVPTAKGWRRFKDLYFFKNFMSAMLFVLTVFVYPLSAAGWQLTHPQGFAALAYLLVFFVAFEITYEILYDLRDLDGDRREGIPTFPVVHGAPRARQIIDALLAAATAVLVVGLANGSLGLREALFVAAPLAQWLFYRKRYARGLNSNDCIQLTNLGTALLVMFLVGTLAWQQLGLPENIFLR